MLYNAPEVDMLGENHKVNDEKQRADEKTTKKSRWLFLRRPPAGLDPIRRLFEPPQRLVEPYVSSGHVIADLGCGSGYYTFALAELAGSAGRVYAVDLDGKCVRALEKKALKKGHFNIEVHASSASDISYIKDRSVDFVFANGLL